VVDGAFDWLVKADGITLFGGDGAVVDDGDGVLGGGICVCGARLGLVDCGITGLPVCCAVLPPWFENCLQWTLASNEPGLTFCWIVCKSRLAPGL
jgi:hypothetical protein